MLKIHDHQQISDFQSSMFEIIRDKFRRPVTSWKRFPDGCDGQFQSRYCVVDLMKACK